MAVIEVTSCGRGAVILRDGRQVWGPGYRDLAEFRADQMRKAARRIGRRCLTCGTGVLSDGAHHRMCDTCRQVGATAEDTAI